MEKVHHNSHEDKLVVLSHVISVNKYECKPCWDIFRKDSGNQPLQYYFYMDCPGGDAFIHWVYEAFLYFPLLREEFEKHPNLKVIVPNRKRYTLNLFKCFDINIPVINDFETYDNICIFPPATSINHFNKTLFEKYFKLYLDNMKFYNLSAKFSIVYLPRNKRENYTPNDRPEPHIDAISDLVVSKGGMTIDTYNINDIKLQLTILNNADVIIAHWGSAVLFNFMPFKNKKMIFFNSDVFRWQCQTQESMDYFMRYISSHNSLYSIERFEELHDLL